MQVTERQAGDVVELARLARREPGAAQRDRYRAVRMAIEGQGAPAIAKTLSRSRRHVQDWVYAYRDGGIEQLQPKPRPGRPTKLPREREAEFKARVDAGPRPSDGVCALRGKDVVRILESEFGVGYTLDGAYDLLHRLGYSCLTPRPVHEKNDPVAAQWFKQSAPFL